MGVVREYGLRRSQILNIFSEFNQKMFFFSFSFFLSFFFFFNFLYDYSKVNTFGTKVQIEDTVFPPLLESGRLFLRGQSKPREVQAVLQGKGRSTFISQLF